MKKEITFSCNPVVNLLFHVICCFDATFPRKPIYKEKAFNWLLPNEMKFFEDNFTMEQTGKISSTAEFAILFQIPSYFSGDTIESLKEVLELMKQKRLDILKNHFPAKGRLIDLYVPKKFQKLFFEGALKRRKRCGKILDTYGKILESVYDRFYRNHWRTLMPKMRETAESLSKQYFEKLDVIDLWEKKTKIGFPYPEFVIELSDPISSLGTTLLAERDAFSYWKNSQTIFTMISHEIGTHSFIQTKTLVSSDFGKIIERDAEKTLRIQEALTHLTNMAIWKEMKVRLSYPETFEDHFIKEIKALEPYFRTLEKRRMSYFDTIFKAFEALGRS